MQDNPSVALRQLPLHKGAINEVIKMVTLSGIFDTPKGTPRRAALAYARSHEPVGFSVIPDKGAKKEQDTRWCPAFLVTLNQPKSN